MLKKNMWPSAETAKYLFLAFFDSEALSSKLLERCVERVRGPRKAIASELPR